MEDGQILALIGLVSGLLLGLSARMGRFCSLGAVEDIVYGGRYYRALMWPVAMGWAMLLLSIALWLGYFNIDAAVYMKFKPNFLAHIIGGLIFGYGMALAGMCGFTGLARVGSGDLRALYVVIIIGISSWATASGPLARLRQFLFNSPAASTDAPPSLAHYISSGSGVPIAGVFALIALILIALPMLRKNFRESYSPIWGMVVGIAIAMAWLGTFATAHNSFSPVTVESHSFSLPLGDALIYLMASSGTGFNFAVGSVAGVILGGLLGSLLRYDFNWEACDDQRELRRIIFGAILMGIGAVVAFGCSIGQGLSAMSVLYIGAPITFASIVLGAHIGLKRLIEG